MKNRVREPADLFRVSVKGFVVKDGKVLLVKEKEYKNLETPGGKIEIGESVEDALKREFLEETGHKINIIRPIYTYNRYDYIFIMYLIELKKKVLEPDVTEIRWASKDEIKRMLKNNETDDHDVKIFTNFVNGEFD